MHGEYTSLLANSRGLVVSITPRAVCGSYEDKPEGIESEKQNDHL